MSRCNRITKISIIVWINLLVTGFSQITPYPDQFFSVAGADSMLAMSDGLSNIISAPDGSGLMLSDQNNTGYIILAAQETTSPFDRGLPSWNGEVSADGSGFKIYMRFPSGTGWSPWLTVGFWKNNIWTSYGTTSYDGGWIDIDYVKLYNYQSQWQFKVELKRAGSGLESPVINKLSFAVSDSRMTDQLNYTDIINDNPPEIFIPTTFYYQYSLDPNIGNSICSPTTVSMILESYDIAVDPVDFAWDTYDPYYHIFGVWPRVVQNASEFGLDGAVIRFRTWSDAYEIIANGGRVAMSIGQPLYSGHLVMLAGFNANGLPIVHDPARSNGYSYVYNKSDLSYSWFDKGGVGYAFYLRDSTAVGLTDANHPTSSIAFNRILLNNFPNPFNAVTTISLSIMLSENIDVDIYDISGKKIKSLHRGTLIPGDYLFNWNGTDDNMISVSSGIYLAVATTADGERIVRNITLLK